MGAMEPKLLLIVVQSLQNEDPDLPWSARMGLRLLQERSRSGLVSMHGEDSNAVMKPTLLDCPCWLKFKLGILYGVHQLTSCTAGTAGIREAMLDRNLTAGYITAALELLL